MKNAYNQEKAYKNLNQDIIDRCIAGDQKAQFKLYKLYYKSMYNASLRIVRESGEAEDIMQESFLVAFEKIDTYEGKVSFGSWLKRIVINRSLDSYRKKKIDLVELNEPVRHIPENEQIDEDEIDFKVERIKEAVNQLPDGFRIVLSLYLFEGYDHAEISEILGISSSTSRSQYARAKQKLLDLLKTI